MTHRRTGMPIWGSLFLVIGVLAGCSTSGPPPELYVLGDAPTISTGAVSQLDAPVIEVKPVRIPDYLDTTDILTRQAAGHMVASATARWGERLSVGVTRAVAASLARRLPQVTVTTSRPLEEPAWQLLIDVDVFEASPGGECVLVARWSLREGRGGRKAREEKLSLAESVGASGDREIVAAMTSQLNQLGDRISLLGGSLIASAALPNLGVVAATPAQGRQTGPVHGNGDAPITRAPPTAEPIHSHED